MDVANYTTGCLWGFDNDWYHGELTGNKAELALRTSACDCFLVRHSQGDLVLSLKHHGEFHHISIKYGPGWYELENGSAHYSFTEVEDLITYYCTFTISADLEIVLGSACKNTNTKGTRCSPAIGAKTIQQTPIIIILDMQFDQRGTGPDNGGQLAGPAC